MLFNSWIFVGFCLLTTLIYYLLPYLKLGANAQVGLLLLASLYFYSYEKPALVLLLLLSIIVNYLISRRIVLLMPSMKVRWLVIWAVTFNILVIAFFKYAGLIIDTLVPDSALDTWLFETISSIPLPIGISFYTFQAISLIIDLTRKDKLNSKMEKLELDFNEGKNVTSFLNIAFYIAFFPQLIAGPIVKAHEFIEQIAVKRASAINWNVVTRSLVTGYFLKMVIADNLKETTVLINSSAVNGMTKIDLLSLFYGYSCQIFADFAGYSLIAIGLGALLGYRLPVNFNFPYISGSITEFWKRWHISLSSWLREYLYIPLGGNRKGALRTYVNLMVVMLLGGLWHGAAWSYMVWGGAHGILLSLERMFGTWFLKWKFLEFRIFRIAKIVYIFHIVSILWLLFVMPDFYKVIEYFEAFSVAAWAVGSPRLTFVVAIYALPIVAYHIYAYWRETAASDGDMRIARKYVEPFVFGTMLFLIVVNSGTPGKFIYFQF